MSRVWHPWAKTVQLQGRALWVGTSRFQKLVPESSHCRPAPEEWRRLEDEMRAATETSSILVGDD
eukprot:16339420-Heterocapsa_arctica.AAC.1